MNNAPGSSSGALRAIAVYKLVEATLLIIVGVGALRLLHSDVSRVATGWIHELHLDPNRLLVRAALTQLVGIRPRTLAALSVGTFVYAALRIVEGVGLWLQKRWAEYLTIIATAALLPIELFEIVRHVTPLRVIVLVLNAAVVIYLVSHMWRKPAPVSAS